MNSLQNQFYNFIKKYININKPVLIAVSGGVDSLALFHLACEVPNLKIAVAHIDHGWREESYQEALILKEMVQQKGIPFHLEKLDPLSLSGNLENACREKRYQFFKFLTEKFGYQCVLLGHHKNDKIETTLKRILEGASIEKIYGIKLSCSIFGVHVLRPLLPFLKKDLEEFLLSKNIAFFNDSTNYNTQYLRSRMRLQIIPFLNENFGKNIESALFSMGEQSEELLDYFEKKFENYPIFSSSWCSYIEVTDLEQHIVDIKFIIKKFLHHNHLFFSKSSIHLISQHLIKNSSNIMIKEGSQILWIDQAKIFYFKKNASIQNNFSLKEGTHICDNWEIKIEKIDGEIQERRGWRSLCMGEVDIVIGMGDYYLSQALLKLPYKSSSSLSKYFSSCKIPVPLRSIAPILLEEGVIKGEFLSEDQNQKQLEAKSKYRIRLRFLDH